MAIKKSVDKCVDKYISAEKKLRKEIEKLEFYGQECCCGEHHPYIELTDYDESVERYVAILYCIKCGGIVENN